MRGRLLRDLTLRPVTDAELPAVDHLGLERARAHVPRCDRALLRRDVVDL